MFCKNCGQETKIGAGFCKNCGQETKAVIFSVTNRDEAPNWFSEHKKGIVVTGLVILAILIYALFYYDIPSQKTDSSSRTISSVVNIVCTSKNGEISGGSGTIMTEDGLILTNAHIIPQINEVPNISDKGCRIFLPDEATGQPKEIYYGEPEITKKLSKDYDIAIIRITSVFIDGDGKSWGTLPKTFPTFQDGSNCEGEYIKLGDSVRIYGYPVTSGGYNLTITDGIVSSFNDDGTILTSAKIDSGNSGGLAIDQDDCFIGIPSAIVEGNYQNLGVIIPPNLINDFIDEVPAQTEDLLISCDSDECYYNGKCLKNPLHSYCVANDPNNAWKCDVGYIESGNYCVVPAPEKTATQLCQEKYGWNTYSDGTYCQCSSGYVWNQTQTACISYSQSCAQQFANTYFTGEYSSDGKRLCDCISGYVWNVTEDGCVTKASIDQACQRDYGYYSYYLGYTKDGKYMCQSY